MCSSPMALQLFVFDMAGTTVADGGDVLRTFQAVAAAHRLDVEPGWLNTRMGWDKEQVFRELLARSGGDVDRAGQLAHEFQTRLAAHYESSPPRALPGVEAAFEELRRHSVRIAFTTGFSRGTADLLLQSLGWAQYPSVASDEVDHGRPAPDLIFEVMRRVGVTDPAAVGAAGDTPSDLQAATAAGCNLVVGVGTGSYTLQELAQHAHTHLLADLSALPQVVLGYMR
jgi:phosphonatase-like hydrolase